MSAFAFHDDDRVVNNLYFCALDDSPSHLEERSQRVYGISAQPAQASPTSSRVLLTEPSFGCSERPAADSKSARATDIELAFEAVSASGSRAHPAPLPTTCILNGSVSSHYTAAHVDSPNAHAAFPQSGSRGDLLAQPALASRTTGQAPIVADWRIPSSMCDNIGDADSQAARLISSHETSTTAAANRKAEELNSENDCLSSRALQQLPKLARQQNSFLSEDSRRPLEETIMNPRFQQWELPSNPALFDISLLPKPKEPDQEMSAIGLTSHDVKSSNFDTPSIDLASHSDWLKMTREQKAIEHRLRRRMQNLKVCGATNLPRHYIKNTNRMFAARNRKRDDTGKFLDSVHRSKFERRFARQHIFLVTKCPERVSQKIAAEKLLNETIQMQEQVQSFLVRSTPRTLDDQTGVIEML